MAANMEANMAANAAELPAGGDAAAPAPPADRLEQLIAACWAGDVAAARATAPARLRAADLALALVAVCTSGRVNIVQWLVGRFNVRKSHVTARSSIAFRLACGERRRARPAPNDEEICSGAAAKWLVEEFGLEGNELGRYALKRAFVGACADGRLGAAQWLADRFAFSRADAHSQRQAAFVGACKGGHLDIAHWLADRFTVSSANVRASGGPLHFPALTTACLAGHLDVAQWLVDAFGLTAADARNRQDLPGDTNTLLQSVCATGVSAAVAWLADAVGLIADDALADDNAALRAACANGHTETAKILVARFGLTAADMRASGSFSAACEAGAWDTVQWIAAEFAPTPEDARARDNAALRGLCEKGRTAPAQWLVDYFGLTVADARADNSAALRLAASNGHRETAQWLIDRFGLATSVEAVARDELAACWHREFTDMEAQAAQLRAQRAGQRAA
jgi:ankyrin repeat protein